MNATIILFSMVQTAVRWRLVVWSYSRRTRGAMVCSFFLGFCRYDSVNEFDSPSVKTHLMTMVPRIPAQEARHRLVWPLTQCRQQGGMGWLHFVLISPE